MKNTLRVTIVLFVLAIAGPTVVQKQLVPFDGPMPNCVPGYPCAQGLNP